jgi:hypothetical protein
MAKESAAVVPSTANRRCSVRVHIRLGAVSLAMVNSTSALWARSETTMPGPLRSRLTSMRQLRDGPARPLPRNGRDGPDRLLHAIVRHHCNAKLVFDHFLSSEAGPTNGFGPMIPTLGFFDANTATMFMVSDPVFINVCGTPAGTLATYGAWTVNSRSPIRYLAVPFRRTCASSAS